MKKKAICLIGLLGSLGMGVAVAQTLKSRSAPSSAPTSTLDVGELMRDQINPALTEISFSLFHERSADEPRTDSPSLADVRLKSALTQLERATVRLVEGSTQEPLAFQIHAVHLQIAVRGLREAVQSNTQNEVDRFFHLSKATCNSCHDSFKD